MKKLIVLVVVMSLLLSLSTASFAIDTVAEEQYETAVEHFEKDVSQEKLNQYALAYYEGNGVEQNYERAVTYWMQSAALGNMEAQFRVGFCYFNGIGIQQDYFKAAEWFVKSAKQGDQGAQYNLGVIYEKGIGVQQDYEKAVQYYMAAAEQGNEFAQCNLAYCYLNGLGVEKNEKLAVLWYGMAAEQGNELAKDTLDDLLLSAGDAIDSTGLFAVSADDYMDMMAGVMNSSLFLEKLPFDPLFTCSITGEDYIICYNDMDLQRVTMWENGNKMTGSNKFSSVMIECPCSVYEDMLCMCNSCVATIFLTSPSSVFDDAFKLYQRLIVAASETDNGEYSHAAISKDRLTYAVEAYVMDKEEDSWYYIFSVTEN